MANPLTPDQLVNALRAEGLRVVTVGSWRTHNRNHKGPFGPINGVMFHHTAGAESGAVSYCYDGSSDLPGPLCHGVITKDGTVHVISAGRANHAGGGDPNVLAAVIDERYGDYPPATHKHDGSSGAVDGNAHFYGFECVNLGNGKDPWPAVQVDAMVRAGAALTRVYGWSSKSVIAHREWSDWKPDPAGPGMPSMKDFRAKIAERLSHPASWNPGTTQPPTTPPQQGHDDMAPNLTALIRGEDMSLTKNAPVEIYWSGEWIDQPNGHGEGGKSVLNNGKYTATLSLNITGLAEGKSFSVQAVGTDVATGVGGVVGHPNRIYGTGTPGLVQDVNFHFTGLTNNLLSFQVVTDGDGVVLADALLLMLSWPN